MFRLNTFTIFLLFNFTLLAAPAAAKQTQEKNREQQIAEKLSVTADADEIIKLKAAGGSFIGVYKRGRSQETGQTNGVVILVHGLGAHPDWPDVISPLRIRLTGSGWSTFSIQMPVLPVEEPVADYGKTMKKARSRIQAAVEYFHDWELQPIILLGYSFGAVQAASYLANHTSGEKENIAAFVSVSMLTQKFIKPGLDVNAMIGRIDIPILDIYGEEDLEEVRRGSDDRRLAARKNDNNTFRQIVLKQARHNYLGYEKNLVNQIQYWLQEITLLAVESREDSAAVPEIVQEIVQEIVPETQ